MKRRNRGGRPKYRDVLFALFDSGEIDTPTVELAPRVGCSRASVDRWRTEYKALHGLALQRPEKHRGHDDPWKALALGIIKQAGVDFNKGLPCSPDICEVDCVDKDGNAETDAHHCQQAAARFLRSRFAEFLFDSTDSEFQDGRTATLRRLGLPLVFSR